MRPTSVRLKTLFAAAAVAATLVMPGSAGATGGNVATCADASSLGCWSAPFSETGKYDAAPPSTPEEALELSTAVSAVVLPSGRVLYWDGLAGLADSNVSLAVDAGRTGDPDRSRVLDLTGAFDSTTGHSAPIWLTPQNEAGGGTQQLFCSDQRLLANGSVIAAGGTDWETANDIPDEVADPEAGAPDGLAELYGSKQSRLYDEDGNGGGWTWDGDVETESGPGDMNFGRWYPSIITLGNGDLLATSGVTKLLWNSKIHDERATDYAPKNVHETETYDPTSNTWSYNGPQADTSLPLYPRLHLLPNGNVFFGGVGQNWSPAGEDVTQNDWNFMKSYDPAANTWVDHGLAQFGSRSGAFSTLLTLEPDADGDYSSASILVGGGTLGTSPGSFVATDLSEVVHVASGPGGSTFTASQQTGSLVNRRWYSSGVLLPNGQALTFSGADKDEVLTPGLESPIRQAELFDPATGTWTGLSSGGRDRTYHNSAILLPDGSVLIGGHSPINLLYGGKGDNSFKDNGFGSAHNYRDPSFEVFYPPYLYKADGSAADRISIVDADTAVEVGKKLKFTIASGSPAVDKVVLSRLPAVTHTTDADARTVDVTTFLSRTGANSDGVTWEVDVPDNANALPPGYYYLFALTASGTPSIASIVNIT